MSEDRNGRIELYNIVDDPGETNNIAHQHPEIVARITAFMEEAHETPEFASFRFQSKEFLEALPRGEERKSLKNRRFFIKNTYSA